MSIDHNTLRNEMIINEPRPSRIRKVTARYRLSPPVIVIPNKAKKSNAIQRRVRRMLAIQNHVRRINTNHQNNINAVEEVIDIAPVVIPRVPIDNEIPYQANPLRRNNALMAIQALIENERIEIEANARNAGLNIVQATDKLNVLYETCKEFYFSN
jgi:hypothetical protein